jgi:hypothetical protein
MNVTLLTNDVRTVTFIVGPAARTINC